MESTPTPLRSCLYEGWVRHQRRAPVAHAFRYRVFLVYLDLGELDRVFDGRWLWSARGRALAEFRRSDYYGDPTRPLDACIRDLVAERTGRPVRGPVALLTHLRYFGYGFNPVSFYYCFDPTGERVEAFVGEVSNTPWDERHVYVCDARSARHPHGGRDAGAGDEPPRDAVASGGDDLGASGVGAPTRAFLFPKRFHVSPFMAMDQTYDWRFSPPGQRLVVHMENLWRGDRPFDATLSLERRPFTAWNAASTLARFPFMTAQVVAAIYWQAFRLWLKRAPYHPHPAPPDGRAATATAPRRAAPAPRPLDPASASSTTAPAAPQEVEAP